MLTAIATMRHATPEAVPWKTPRDRRSRKSRAAPRPRMKPAQLRILSLKNADYTASGRSRCQIITDLLCSPLSEPSSKSLNKTIFLTGASSGIGLAIAETLAARGHQIWGTSRDPARLPRLPGLHPVQLDLSDRQSIDTAFNTALAEANHFDVLINNAGSGHFGSAERLLEDEVLRQFQILVFGHLHLMQLALKSMHAQGSGLIINVTSLAARLPVPFMAAYNAAKAAMAAFTMSIQLELGNSAIRIVDLQPADIRTAFNDAVVRDHIPESMEERVEKTWRAVENNMANAPGPELVARHVLRLMDSSNPPPRLTVGDMFQSKIAPFLLRFLPHRVQIWGLKKYYGI